MPSFSDWLAGLAVKSSQGMLGSKTKLPMPKDLRRHRRAQRLWFGFGLGLWLRLRLCFGLPREPTPDATSVKLRYPGLRLGCHLAYDMV